LAGPSLADRALADKANEPSSGGLLLIRR